MSVYIGWVLLFSGAAGLAIMFFAPNLALVAVDRRVVAVRSLAAALAPR
jgi:hypothetical protein